MKNLPHHIYLFGIRKSKDYIVILITLCRSYLYVLSRQTAESLWNHFLLAEHDMYFNLLERLTMKSTRY